MELRVSQTLKVWCYSFLKLCNTSEQLICVSVSFENLDIESKWDVCVRLRRYPNCADIGKIRWVNSLGQ